MKISNKNKLILRRVCAYLIDLIIVMLLSTMICKFEFINPNINSYDNYYNEYVEYMKSGNTDENYLKNLTYNIYKTGYNNSIVTVVCYLSYFVVFNYFTDGQTVGKKFLKIKISSEKGKVTLWHYLLRSLFIYNLLPELFVLATILFIPETLFINLNSIFSSLFSALMYFSILLALFRDDGKGLHDIVCKTYVEKTKK